MFSVKFFNQTEFWSTFDSVNQKFPAVLSQDICNMNVQLVTHDYRII